MFSLPPLPSPFYSRFAHNHFLFSASSPTVLSSPVLLSIRHKVHPFSLPPVSSPLFSHLAHSRFLFSANFSTVFSSSVLFSAAACSVHPPRISPVTLFSAFPSSRISPKPVNCILSHRAAPRRDREGLFYVRCRGGAALGRVRGVSAVCVGVCPGGG